MKTYIGARSENMPAMMPFVEAYAKLASEGGYPRRVTVDSLAKSMTMSKSTMYMTFTSFSELNKFMFEYSIREWALSGYQRREHLIVAISTIQTCNRVKDLASIWVGMNIQSSMHIMAMSPKDKQDAIIDGLSSIVRAVLE